jgi:hypothetical protein
MLNHIRPFHSLARWAGIAALLLIFPAAHAAGLNDTGITTCSNADTNGLPCPVAGFPGQDAEFGSNGFDFTKLDAAGNDLPATATDHTCVRDNVTGLIWQVKISSSKYTFDGAASYVTSVNSTGLCGFDDWRMPNVKELFGIADHSIAYPGPTIDTNYFPNTPSGDYSWFWSGSPYAYGSDGAWYVPFGSGVAYYYNRGSYYHVRLVRGGTVTFDTFVDNEDGTVTQSNTGLMWAKCSEGQTSTGCGGNASKMNWSAALNTANNSNLGGYSDWRLPSVKELHALVDYSGSQPAIDISYFPNTPNDWFWSGSPYAKYSNYSRYVDFYRGVASKYSRDHDNRVRLVRGGRRTVTFDPFALTVAKTGDGAGTVTSVPAGIDCGATCTASFDRSSNVMLTASSASGSRFDGWSGDCTDTGILCTVNLNKTKRVTATFTTVPTALGLSINKVGSGTVSSDPAGINCGSCTVNFSNGIAVTLTAKPASGYRFSGWSGGGCSGSGGCTVNMTVAQNVTATFTAVFPLTISKPSNGTVTSSDASINCGSSCSASFSTGKSVTLTATPASGYLFNGWSGACSGTSATCIIDMTAAKKVSAVFVVIPAIYSLTVSKTGTGMVSSDPGGINCGSGADCTANFLNSTKITLTAAPASGYSFGGWSGGGCTDSATTCTLTLSASTTVSATFIVDP